MTAQLPLPLLPLRGSASLPGGLACLSPACWSTPRVGLEGSCCVLFLRACSVRFFPAAGSLRIFWASPAPLDCWGSWALHPVSGCSSCSVVCLVCRWGSPAAFFFTLKWVCFWLRCLQSLWAAKAVSAALRGLSSFSCVCWSFTFSGVGVVFWSQVGGPSCDSWFWTLLMLGYTFLTP